jgi:type IV secretory pathway TrbD component
MGAKECRTNKRLWCGSDRAFALSAGIIAAFVLMVFSILVLGFGGYAQRLLMALLFGWMIVVALHLTRTRNHSQP